MAVGVFSLLSSGLGHRDFWVLDSQWLLPPVRIWDKKVIRGTSSSWKGWTGTKGEAGMLYVLTAGQI